MLSIALEKLPPDPTEQRIGWLTLLFGFTASLIATIVHRPGWPLGLALGTFLAWLNFRWLRRGLDALVAASAAQSGREQPEVPLSTYFMAAFRYALIAVSVYGIFTYLHVPLASLIVGLCALGAAALVASVYEIMRPAV